MPEDEDEYISIEEAAQMLSVSIRSTQRYAQQDRVRSRRVGNRLQVNQADVLALADEIGSINKRPAPPQSVPADVLLGYVEKLRVETNTLNSQIGQLQEQLKSRPLLEDHVTAQIQRDQAIEQRDTMIAERDAMARHVAELERQIKELSKPWYKRILGS